MVPIQTSMNPTTETVTQVKIRSSRKPSRGPFSTQSPPKSAIGTRTAIAMVKRRNPTLESTGRREATTRVMENSRASAR